MADIKAAPAIWLDLLERHERISKILADQSYRSEILTQRLQAAYGCRLEISQRLGMGFRVAPQRWAVERTLAWLECPSLVPR